jgi:hypothetical protein
MLYFLHLLNCSFNLKMLLLQIGFDSLADSVGFIYSFTDWQAFKRKPNFLFDVLGGSC